MTSTASRRPREELGIDRVPAPELSGPTEVAAGLPPGLQVEDVPARQASRAVLAVLALRLVAAAVGTVVAGLLARQLGAGGFGELSLVFAVAILASSIGEVGSTQVVVAEMAARTERRRELAAGLAVLRTATGTALALGGALLLVALLDRRSAEWAGVAVMATIPLAGMTALVVLEHARLRPHVGAALSLTQSVLWLASVVVAAALDAPLAVYGAAFLGCGFAQAVASWAVVVRREPPAWSAWKPALRWIVTRSWPLALATMLGTVYYRFDAVLVFRLAGRAEAGFYAAAYRFLDVVQLLPAAVAGVLLPVLARGWRTGDRASVERLWRLGLTVTAAAAVPIAVGAVVAGDRVAAAVFGSAFAPAGAALSVLGLAFFSIATGYVYSSALVATGQVRAVAVVAAVAAVASVVAGVLVIPRGGAVGAAWVTVGVEYFVSSTLAVWISLRSHLRPPWSRWAAAAAAGAVMAAVGWPLRDAALPVLLGITTTAYIAAAAVFGAVTANDIRLLTDPRLGLGTTAEGSR